MNPEPIGIVLFNLGGPGDLSEVEPFLVNLFSDREIIELPGGAALQPLMARIIAKMRGPSVRANYARIGGGSPQLRLTKAQASALEHRLNGLVGEHVRFRVVIAMRYSAPTCADALGELAAADVRKIVTLTLFPHYSKATTGSSRHEFDRALAESHFARLNVEVAHVEHYADDPRYLDAFAGTVREAFERIPARRRDDTVILFSAHGLPQKFIDEGDPYVRHIEATRQGLLRRLNLPNRQLLAYQSRTGPVKWLGPGTEEVIEQLGRQGVKDLLVVPLSFVSDHIETLYEVDLLFAETARQSGITGYFRPDALNANAVFIDALAHLVLAEQRETVVGTSGHRLTA
jgi:protoporphyrin/coproporphyrin ferrochelatase